MLKIKVLIYEIKERREDIYFIKYIKVMNKKKLKIRINMIKKFIIHPKSFLIFLASKGIIRYDDKAFIEYVYFSTFKKKINLKNPQTFNEKLQWLKLHDHNILYTYMVDKYKVKEYVSNIIGNKYIVDTLGTYNKFNEINFDILPNKFVIKTTHDSGGIVIVKDKRKINIRKVKRKINKHLRKNYYYHSREWPYKNVKPKIIIEKYIEDNNDKELRDYKFFCFNGKVKFFKVDFDRFTNHHANYYDVELNLLPFGEKNYLPDREKKIIIPDNINEMIDLAEKLSKNITFVRVDFYNVNGKIYFGEMTFYPASGFGKFEPDEWDEKIGDMLELPIKSEEKNEK